MRRPHRTNSSFNVLSLLPAICGALLSASLAHRAGADAPCGELDACRVLIEINASAGDIGFHVLFDLGEGWREATLTGPHGKKLLDERASKGLRDQAITENFFESAEPVCEGGLKEEEGDEVVTLPEFLQRFPAGWYRFRNKLEGGEQVSGRTALTHVIPAAPAEVDFDGSEISWEYGNDLGECTTWPTGFDVADEEDIAAYEVVLEPDDEAWAHFKFTVQVPATANSVAVPDEYLAALPDNVPIKVEVGAIEMRPNGSFGNQTFTEADGFCNNVDQDACRSD